MKNTGNKIASLQYTSDQNGYDNRKNEKKADFELTAGVNPPAFSRS